MANPIPPTNAAIPPILTKISGSVSEEFNATPMINKARKEINALVFILS